LGVGSRVFKVGAATAYDRDCAWKVCLHSIQTRGLEAPENGISVSMITQ